MIDIYCWSNCITQFHLCDNCKDIHAYVLKKLDNCQFKTNKPSCRKCTKHCYSVSMRDEIKRIMRFSGPRMIWKHPFLTFIHFLK